MGLPLLPGLVIQEFFDTLTHRSQLNFSPLTLVVLLLFIGLARIAAIFAGRITKTQHRFTISSLIQRNLLATILERPGAEAFRSTSGQTLSPGEIMSYFRDDVAQIEDVVVGTNEIFAAGLFALVSLLILSRISLVLTLFAFLPILLIILLLHWAEGRIMHYRRTSRYATQQVTGLIIEMFSTIQAIQVAGAESSIIEQFRLRNDQRRRLMVRDQVFSSALNAGLENLVNLGIGFILFMVALGVARGDTGLTVGELTLFVYYLTFVTDFLAFLGTFVAAIQQTAVTFERLSELLPLSPHSLPNPSIESALEPHPLVVPAPLYLPNLNLPNLHWFNLHLPNLYSPNLHSQTPPLPTHPLPVPSLPLQYLTVDHLTYQYPDSDQGIFNISFTLTQGSLTVITGRVGSGKTTLLRVLLGLLPARSGSITWNHQRVIYPDRFFVPPRSAYTPQTPQLFSHTLRENLLLGLEIDESTLRRAIQLGVIEADITAMPDGLDTVIGTKGVRLSGGQQQRSAAVRMFVRQPELLVLDDLSSALDVETEQRLWSRLLRIRQLPQGEASHWQPTCLIVSHREAILQQANQVIVLEKGMIKEIIVR
ncbi:MAG: ABC transporter ATP-binding protein/permease [Elainella sp. Prado103]|jgi:ABC-type multidrug transport system fused ATPase/permease subunit|nr:ABC transporter ATP-binding protein/permease [Elainella sp. Prado103]